MFMRNFVWISLVLMAVVWTAGCGDQSRSPKGKGAGGNQVHPPEALAVGKVAPDIEGEGIDGKPLKLSDYRGKVVVLDFWGNW
jgi:hypothetical protein